MKKATKIIVGTIAALGIIAATGAYAGKQFMNGMKGDFIIYKLEKELDLSTAQVDRLKDIKTYVKSHHDTHDEHHNEHKAQFIELLNAPTLDQTKVLAMLDEMMQSMRSEAPTMISKVAEFSDTLTDTQRTELLEMIQKRSHGKRHMRHGWGDHH
jgi:Spy/CpxP family protein refolding chaperone